MHLKLKFLDSEYTVLTLYEDNIITRDHKAFIFSTRVTFSRIYKIKNLCVISLLFNEHESNLLSNLQKIKMATVKRDRCIAFKKKNSN